MPSLLLWLWAAFLVAPAAGNTHFDGLPFSSIPEVIAVVLFLPVACSASSRRWLARGFGRSDHWVRMALLAGVTVGLALKIGLLASQPAGFLACYESTLKPLPTGPCERSFENPWFRYHATRLDPAIDFGPEDWDLSFVNSLRFNIYPSVAGNRRRDRLPFAVTWRGTVDSHGSQADISYVGQAVISVDGRSMILPPAYDSRHGAKLDLPAGRHLLRIRYSFDDGSKTLTNVAVGPYATFRLKTLGAGGEDARALSVAAPPVWAALAAGAVDAVAVAGTLALLLCHGWLLRRRTRAVLTVAATFAVVFLAFHRLGLPAAAGAAAVTWVLLGLILAKNRSTTLLLGYVTLVMLSAWLAIGAYPRLGAVWYRSAGDDWLTYESYARSFLETRSLAGGEAVFYIQPFFRYVRFLEHFVFGDGDPLIDAFAWVALHWCVLWAASVLFVGTGMRLRRWRFGTLLFAASAALTLALSSSDSVQSLTRLSLSEHVTWIFLAAAIPLLASRQPMRWSLGAALLASALITRPNQAPALFAVAVAFLASVARPARRRALVAFAVFSAVCLLPLAHNLYFGGRAVLFTTTASNPAALGVPLSTLAKVASDSAARTEVLTQIRGLLFLPPKPFGGDTWTVAVIMHGLQIVWLASVFLAWRWRLPWHVKLLAAVPLLFLLVHVVYDIRVYYPRHILAAYFAMGLVTMAVSMARPTRVRAQPMFTVTL